MKVMRIKENPPRKPGSFGPLSDYEGVFLTDIVHNFPLSSWKTIMDRAIETVELLDLMDIMNEDISPRNFIFPKSEKKKFSP